MNLLIEPESFRSVRETVSLTRLRFGFRELVAQEEFLLAHYDAVLKELEGRGRKARPPKKQ